MKENGLTFKSHKWLFVFMMCLLFPLSGWAGQTKNVIVLIPDGTGATHTTVARWYKGFPLALDQMDLGAVRTYGADSLITDSAPAATAFATGQKSGDKLIGILPDAVTIPGVPQMPDNLKYKPIATVLEAAKLYGKSVGMIATSNIQHATPAAYSSHWHDRSNYNEISEQQVYLDMDVVFGGGKKYLTPKEMGGTRTDGENLIEVLRSRGYAFVENRDDMMKTQAQKVWGMFADDAMAYEFDRKHFLASKEPSLAEMTQKAIQILSSNPKGFFLFVEGSKVDWASHANDPIGVISDTLAFDDAVGVAVDFAKQNGETLVLAFTDHGNGGMSLGHGGTDKTYSKLPLNALIAPLKKAKLTGEGIEKALGQDLSEANIRKVMAQHYGIEDLTPDEINRVQKCEKGTMNYVVGPMISKRSVIGWTTTGHTGEDVFLYSYGAGRSFGLVENTRIAHICAQYLGVDLDLADARLYPDAMKRFQDLGVSVRIDKTVKENPTLVLEKGPVTAMLPLSKDTIKVSVHATNPGHLEAEYQLEGLTILAEKTDKVYISEHAAAFLQSVFEDPSRIALQSSSN